LSSGESPPQKVDMKVGLRKDRVRLRDLCSM
jgi:hypothetical protein